MTALLFRVFDFEADLDGLPQHGRDRTILLFREPHRILDRFVGNLSSHAVDQANLSIDGWRAGRAFRQCTYFQAGEGLAFLAQDAGYIVAGAPAEPDEDKLHGAVAGLLVAVDHNGVAGAGDAVKAVVRDPGGACLSHDAPLTKYD